ncbi:MAG: chromosome segregation protein SMC [bacterium]
MYLKSLELIGFKSFADRTVLRFDPGMTAVVGPNGCGKSNVSDSLRWVLGETSAKALRGAKMEDVIFNGAESRKPLGMAEVSVTFAECEGTLGTEYNEVTVTRRVARSGEGSYFLNKTPCRLKDIQRLFLGTGVGTDSYSMMEQGRIDQVLSSHPEDRREIFEEAAGITRFKADKKEALRKLEQTEVNLVRLADVIREVKRQIGSLQRQAGKARRYKELRSRLRELDLYRTAGQVTQMESSLHTAEATLAEHTQKLESLQAALRTQRAREVELRSAVMDVEHSISDVTEARATAQTRLDRNSDTVRMNRDRLAEMQRLSERDRAEIAAATAQTTTQRETLAALERDLTERSLERDAHECAWRIRQESVQQHEQMLAKRRADIQRLRNEAMDSDATLVRLQNQLTQMDARERDALLQRERLGGEHARLATAVAEQEERERGLTEALAGLRAELQRGEQVLADQLRRRSAAQQAAREIQQAIAELRNQASASTAQIELLTRADMMAKDFPDGARLLLQPDGPFAAHRHTLLGALAHLVEAEPAYHTALEATLRAWLDAVLVTDAAAALAILNELRNRRAGPARLLALLPSDGDSAETQPVLEGPGELLLDHIHGDASIQPLLRRLLWNVRIVETLDTLPAPLPRQAVFVTKNGAVVRGDGACEFWMPDPRTSNPLTRRHMVADLQHTLDEIQGRMRDREAALQEQQETLHALEIAAAQTEAAVQEHRHTIAVRQGEQQVVGQAARQARQRIETVGAELEELNRRLASAETRREMACQMESAHERQGQSRSELDTQTQSLQDAEAQRAILQNEVNELRMHHVESRQLVEHLVQRQSPAQARLRELETLIATRTQARAGYQTGIAQMQTAITEAEGQTSALRHEVEQAAARLESLRSGRNERAVELAAIETALAGTAQLSETTATTKARLDVTLAEDRLRLQSRIERTISEYAIVMDDLRRAPEPVWDGDRPAPEALDAAITELRSHIEAIGPVNLVAIEEYQELEERFAFLTKQDQDLQSGRQQLHEMIRKINATTAEMFRTTFDQININFQAMFERLFNGGTARLVLIEGEDILEAGIDVIARPPGKRQQTISLLSGGERTMTAVAMLFAIYMIKPSPFCALDELDAALDESNIGRFVKVLQDFLKQSQFIVITHNRRSIAAANTIYGVTMTERGISRVVSMKFSEYEHAKEFQTETKRAAALIPAETLNVPDKSGSSSQADKTPAATEDPA